MCRAGIRNWWGVKVSVVNLLIVGEGEGEGGVSEKEYEEIRFLLRQEKCKVLGASESRLLCLVMLSFTSYLSLLPYSLSCNPHTDRLHVTEGQIMNANEGETRQY
jgi:hypothetical protein